MVAPRDLALKCGGQTYCDILCGSKIYNSFVTGGGSSKSAKFSVTYFMDTAKLTCTQKLFRKYRL